MLTTNGKNYIANKFGIGGCFVATGKTWSYRGTDGVTYNESGGTAQIVSRLVMTSLVQSVTVDGVVYTYTALKTANDNTDLTLDDASWVAANDGSPAGEAKYCAGATATNSITNPGFELWSGGVNAAPDGWNLTGLSAVVAKETVNVRSGSAALKLTGNASATLNWVRYPLNGDLLNGKTVTFRVWMKSSSNQASILIRDAAATQKFHSGSGLWEQLSVTKVYAKGTSYNELRIDVPGNTSIVLYADDAELIVGGTTSTPAPGTPTPTPAPGTTPTPAPQAGSGAPGLAGTFEFIPPPTGVPTASLDLGAINMRLTTDGRFEINDVKLKNLTGYDIYVAAEVRLFAGAKTSCPTSGETFRGIDRTQTVNRDQRVRLMSAYEEQVMNLDFYPPQLSGVYTVCIYIHGSYFRADLVQEVGSITT